MAPAELLLRAWLARGWNNVEGYAKQYRVAGAEMRTVLSVSQVESLRVALSEPGVLFLEQTKLLHIARSIVPDILNETVFR